MSIQGNINQLIGTAATLSKMDKIAKEKDAAIEEAKKQKEIAKEEEAKKRQETAQKNDLERRYMESVIQKNQSKIEQIRAAREEMRPKIEVVPAAYQIKKEDVVNGKTGYSKY